MTPCSLVEREQDNKCSERSFFRNFYDGIFLLPQALTWLDSITDPVCISNFDILFIMDFSALILIFKSIALK